MDSKRVNQVLRAVARPILKDHGFAFHTERSAGDGAEWAQTDSPDGATAGAAELSGGEGE